MNLCVVIKFMIALLNFCSSILLSEVWSLSTKMGCLTFLLLVSILKPIHIISGSECNDQGKCLKIIIANSIIIITLNFINQPKESEKWYIIRHGPANPGCTELPSTTKGHLSNSLSISVELHLTDDITKNVCFEIIVRSDDRNL